MGFPLADPIVGMLISIAILVLLFGTVRDIGRRLLDGVDPDLVDRSEAALAQLPGVAAVAELHLRWLGHRLSVDGTVQIDPAMTIEEFHRIRA